MMRINFIVAAALAVAAPVAVVHGQASPQAPTGRTPTKQQRPAAAPAQGADTRTFINDITIAGLAEVTLGEMASQKAANADVKAFGQMMVKDHGQANNELAQIAAQLQVQPPAQLDKKHSDLADRLSKLQGAEFDREYMAAMVSGHEEVVAKVRARTAVSAQAPGEQALTQWAAKALPTVQRHLERAKELSQKAAKSTD